MASTSRRAVVAGAFLALTAGLAGCGGDPPTATPATVRVSSDIVEVWRQQWEPYATRFWDAVDAWHLAEGSPTDLPFGGLAAAAASAAPAIVAGAAAWSQALPATDLPGDVNARAAGLTTALTTVAGTWSQVEACAKNSACVTTLLAAARRELYDLRSAEFELRPR